MGVLVVGMHRSGTSALASALEAMGFTAGPPEGLMAVNRENPAGYYEQQSFAHFNEEVLAHLGGGWDCPPELQEGWSTNPSIAPLVARASKLVDSTFGSERFVLKDPRMAVLLPLWRRALLDRCSVTMIVRDPIEVAWSLLLRNGMPMLTGLALWSSYSRAALAGLAGLPVYVCSYEELLRTPRETLGAISESLKAWGELPVDIDLGAASGRIEPDLRRDTWPRDLSKLSDVPEEVIALDKYLKEQIGSHERFEVEEPRPPWWERPLLDERRAAWQLRRQAELDSQRIFTFQEQVSEFERSLALSAQRLADAEQRASSAEEQARVNAAVLQQMTAERDTQSQELLRTQAELTVWTSRWNEVERNLLVRIYNAVQRGMSKLAGLRQSSEPTP